MVHMKTIPALTAADSVAPSTGAASKDSPGRLSARLVLADSHRLVIQSLATALTRCGLDVVAVATTPREVLAQVAEHRPDICLLSTHLSSCSGLDVLRVISKHHPGVGVVLLSSGSDPELARAAFRSGAAAVISRNWHISDIEHALSCVSQHEQAFNRGVLKITVRDVRLPGVGNGHTQVQLTSREKEVLGHIAEGERTRQIARSLGISEATVRTHVQNMLSKLGVHSRLEAAIVAAQTDCDLPGVPAQRAPGVK
jgi:two-component system nitrate/nitrite response regulator NarL